MSLFLKVLNHVCFQVPAHFFYTSRAVASCKKKKKLQTETFKFCPTFLDHLIINSFALSHNISSILFPPLLFFSIIVYIAFSSKIQNKLCKMNRNIIHPNQKKGSTIL